MFEFFKKLFSPIILIMDFITKYFKTIVFLFIVYLILGSSSGIDSNVKVANLQRIDLMGPIINVDSILKDIKEAKKDKNIKGVLFVVDSPGGSVAPSIEIAHAIKELRKFKPVITYARGTIASGSYYASIWSNKIIANPGSLVGSIGVIMQAPNFQNIMSKIGLSSQTVKAGKYKEAGTPIRKWTDYEKNLLQNLVDDTYDIFVSDVVMARKLKIEDKDKFANAKVFTARLAKKVGLIDEVATIDVAEKELIEISKINKPVWKEKDQYEQLMEKIINKVSSNVSTVLFNSIKMF